MRQLTYALKCIGAVVFAVNANAQSIVAVTADRPFSPSGGAVNALSNPFSVVMGTSALRSYCCEAFSNEAELQFTRVQRLHPTQGNADASFAYRGAQSPPISQPLGPLPGFNLATQARVCLLPTGQAYQFDVGTLSNLASFTNVHINCEDTSLFGGFNTYSGEYNFLEVSNRDLAAVNVRVRGYSETSGGAQVVDLTFPVSGLSLSAVYPKRVDIDIHSLVGPSAFGSLVVTHDGAPGAIGAVVSMYKRTSATSVSDFVLVGRIPFERQSR